MQGLRRFRASALPKKYGVGLRTPKSISLCIHTRPKSLKQNWTQGVPVNKTTRDNLTTAMQSEAFTYAKYMLYAERARKTGNPELAQLLEKTAKQELSEHFAEEAALAEIVRSDVDNLQDAIASESFGIRIHVSRLCGASFLCGRQSRR
jgi:hypothetical protein